MSVKQRLAIIGKEIFEISLVSYLALLVVESFKPGSVGYFFNLNYLLLIVLLSGVLMVLFEPQKKQKNGKTCNQS